jgi:hypothetical protein
MAKTTYNYKRYKMSEYDLGAFPGAKAGELAKDFIVHDQEGNKVSLDHYRGKWVVLETGSITCAMYVKNISGIKKLQAKYPDIEFLLVYVREAHPGTRLGPHESDSQKIKRAQQLRDFYDEPRRILIDDLDGTMHKAYGELPNMVYHSSTLDYGSCSTSWWMGCSLGYNDSSTNDNNCASQSRLEKFSRENF